MEWAEALDVIEWIDDETSTLHGIEDRGELADRLLEIETQFRVLHPRQKITLLLHLLGRLVEERKKNNE